MPLKMERDYLAAFIAYSRFQTLQTSLQCANLIRWLDGPSFREGLMVWRTLPDIGMTMSAGLVMLLMSIG